MKESEFTRLPQQPSLINILKRHNDNAKIAEDLADSQSMISSSSDENMAPEPKNPTRVARGGIEKPQNR